MLYKNCWEHAEAEPNSRPRTEHARANLIQGNRFSDQPFGVWVAARQSRDLEAMECGDPTPYENPIDVTALLPSMYWDYPSSYVESYLFSLNSVHVWPDFAEENMITENRFERISLGGIRVEDDDTDVTQNLFLGDFDYIFLGAPFRARLANQPVQNTLIQANAFVSEEDSLFIDHLALMPDEHISTILEDNHRACSFDDGQILFHGEVMTQAEASNQDCPETEYRCEEGSLVALDEGCEINEDQSDAGQNDTDHSLSDQDHEAEFTDMNLNEMPSLDSEMSGDQGELMTFSSDQEDQGCMTWSRSPSLPIMSILYLLALLLRKGKAVKR